MNNNIENLINILKKRLNSIIKYRHIDKVKYFEGLLKEDSKNKILNNKAWKDIKLPHQINDKTESWISKVIKVPREIHGIKINGSEMTINGAGFLGDQIIIAKAELIIDKKEVLSEENYIDLRYQYQISPNVSPGEEHVFNLHIINKKGFGDLHSRIPAFEVRYSLLEDVIFELKSFINELDFGLFLPEGKRVIEKAIDNIEIDKFETISLYDVLREIEEIRNKLVSLKPIAKNFKIHMIGHAHIDMTWLWPLEETFNNVCPNTFNTVNKLMEEYPEFKFSQSQAYLYEKMENKYPYIFQNIKKRVNEGRWDITASAWVEFDPTMACGESIVRQILYAKLYIKEKFGFDTEVCWMPDNFGHPWTLPQILKKSGLNYYYFMRSSRKGFDLFFWESPDGSRVIAFNSAYLGNVDSKTLIQLAKYNKANKNVDTSMFVYGIGDHGGGPTKEDIELINKLNKKNVYPKLEFSTTKKYFEDIKNNYKNLPVLKDEPGIGFDGCYTIHSDLKIHNRMCEKLLLDAEKIGSISAILGGEYPDLEESWKSTLFNQFHDLLPGSSIKSAYDYTNKEAEISEKKALDSINKSILYISNNIKTKDKGIPIIVFNTLAWQRDDVVKINMLDKIPEKIVICDDNGKTYPAQIVNGQLIFIAEEIPALGYKTFYISKGVYSGDSIVKDGLKLENEFFLMGIDKNSGTISYLYDKKNKKIVMRDRIDEGIVPENTFPFNLEASEMSNLNFPVTRTFTNNLLQVLYEEKHPMPDSVIGPISKIENLLRDTEIEILATGSVMGSIRIKKKFNKSIIIQDINLYRKINRIDIDTYINWKENSEPNAPDPMLKASFTPVLGKTKATFEIPFGSIERVADGREVPALNWVDISDENYGLSLLSDTKYGFDVKGNTVRITLIRNSNEPDPDPDIGEQRFTYSLYPHNCDWKYSNTVKRGLELNHKFITSYYIRTNKNCLPTNLPPKKSFLLIDNPNVILTCLKKAEMDKNLIFRVYETIGKKVKTSLDFGFDIINVEEVNLLEEKIESSDFKLKDNRLTFYISPYEIKSFKIIRGKK
ncbi:hypothetical protein ES705_01767 [subsurface metagenome]|nr:hypothetical protein [Clostridia bacterium]